MNLFIFFISRKNYFFVGHPRYKDDPNERQTCTVYMITIIFMGHMNLFITSVEYFSPPPFNWRHVLITIDGSSRICFFFLLVQKTTNLPFIQFRDEF